MFVRPTSQLNTGYNKPGRSQYGDKGGKHEYRFFTTGYVHLSWDGGKPKGIHGGEGEGDEGEGRDYRHDTELARVHLTVSTSP